MLDDDGHYKVNGGTPSQWRKSGKSEVDAILRHNCTVVNLGTNNSAKYLHLIGLESVTGILL